MPPRQHAAIEIIVGTGMMLVFPFIKVAEAITFVVRMMPFFQQSQSIKSRKDTVAMQTLDTQRAMLEAKHATGTQESLRLRTAARAAMKNNNRAEATRLSRELHRCDKRVGMIYNAMTNLNESIDALDTVRPLEPTRVRAVSRRAVRRALSPGTWSSRKKRLPRRCAAPT
jgi:hypothetical protein